MRVGSSSVPLPEQPWRRPATRFVGREVELSAVRRLLRPGALVTVHGPGGIGKTRLAMESVGRLEPGTRSRTAVVQLGEVSQSELVPALLASTLGVNPTTKDPLQLVCEHLGGQSLVLVLDTCEHVADGVVRVVEELARRCPRVAVLTTSRHLLGLPGEAVVDLHSLAVTSPAGTGTVDGDAVVLFLDRARTADPTFRADETTLPVVRDICTRVGGIPQAIELAAARLRALTLEQIADRLADPLALLSAPTAHLPPRLRSMRDSARWSFGLCSPAERRLWAMVSRFAGSFDLDALEAVCDDAGLDTGSAPVLDLVQALTDKSVLVGEPVHGRMRYSLPDPLRSLGRDQDDGPPRDAVAAAHARWYAGVARGVEESWVGPGQSLLLSRAESDLPNLRQAIDTCLERAELTELLYDLALMPTSQLWWTAGHVDEGLYWLGRILRHVDTTSELRARALRNDATLRLAKGDLVGAGASTQEAARLESTLPPAVVRPGAQTFVRAFGLIIQGEHEQALDTLLADLPTIEDRPRPLDFQLRQLIVYAGLGTGDDDRVLSTLADIEHLSRRHDEEYYLAFAHHLRALDALGRGDDDAATTLLESALRISRSFPHRPENPDALQVAALLAARRGERELAEVLAGAAVGTAYTAVALTTTYLRGHPQLTDLEELAASLTACRTSAWWQGRRLSPARAIEEALDAAPHRSGSPRQARLTPREHEVAALVAKGLTDREIAETLVISVRTAEGHVSRALAKLGVRSRREVATAVRDH